MYAILTGRFAVKPLWISQNTIAIIKSQSDPQGQGAGRCSVSAVKSTSGIFVTVCAHVCQKLASSSPETHEYRGFVVLIFHALFLVSKLYALMNFLACKIRDRREEQSMINITHVKEY